MTWTYFFLFPLLSFVRVFKNKIKKNLLYYFLYLKQNKKRKGKKEKENHSKTV
jgi:hypothetical protein